MIPIWNSLPDYVVASPTINTFKARLHKFGDLALTKIDIGIRKIGDLVLTKFACGVIGQDRRSSANKS